MFALSLLLLLAAFSTDVTAVVSFENCQKVCVCVCVCTRAFVCRIIPYKFHIERKIQKVEISVVMFKIFVGFCFPSTEANDGNKINSFLLFNALFNDLDGVLLPLRLCLCSLSILFASNLFTLCIPFG